MISLLITIIVYIVVLGLLYWLVDYLLGVFPLPDPVGKLIRAAVIIIMVLVLVGLLLEAAGTPTGLPRLRVG
jgi:hypothetical protein